MLMYGVLDEMFLADILLDWMLVAFVFSSLIVRMYITVYTIAYTTFCNKFIDIFNFCLIDFLSDFIGMLNVSKLWELMYTNN